MLPLIPLGLAAGGAVLAALALTKKPASEAVDQAAAKSATNALKEGDFQTAAADAIASNSEETVRAVARGMLAAGKSNEAKSLARAFAQLRKVPKKKKAKKALAAKAVAIPSTKALTKAPGKAVVVKKKTVDVPAPVAQAMKLREMLALSTRYKEDRAAVKAYQAANSLGADGLYGAGTARSLWNLYKLVPPNPFYWPSKDTAKALSSYRAFLDEIARNDPSKAETIKALKLKVGS
jgi:murein L,D-transpeptidase YcbB/YkuD